MADEEDDHAWAGVEDTWYTQAIATEKIRMRAVDMFKAVLSHTSLSEAIVRELEETWRGKCRAEGHVHPRRPLVLQQMSAVQVVGEWADCTVAVLCWVFMPLVQSVYPVKVQSVFRGNIVGVSPNASADDTPLIAIVSADVAGSIDATLAPGDLFHVRVQSVRVTHRATNVQVVGELAQKPI